MILSRFVQSRNNQNDERKRFLEPEVATLPRTAPRQPPLQRLGLGKLSGKCYTGRPTRLVEACRISIAVGSSAAAFSRRSVKTGWNKKTSDPVSNHVPSTSNSWIGIRSRCLSAVHSSPGFLGPAAGIGGVYPDSIVVDGHLSLAVQASSQRGNTPRYKLPLSLL